MKKKSLKNFVLQEMLLVFVVCGIFAILALATTLPYSEALFAGLLTGIVIYSGIAFIRLIWTMLRRLFKHIFNKPH